MESVNGIGVHRLTQRHNSVETAIGVITVHLHAYMDRLGREHEAALRRMLRADVRNDLEETREQLRKGPDDGWYWVIAFEVLRGAVIVRGFALCIVRPLEIFLAEIHTHPCVQRQGLARAMLQEVLRFVADGPRGVVVAGLPVTLNVARERPNDDTEHPFAWYKALGFVEDGAGEDFVAGELRLPTTHMRGSIGQILTNLQIDRGDAVD